MWFDMLSVILLRFCIGSLRSAYLPLAQPPHMFQILCRRGIRRSKYTAERQRRFRQRAGLTNRNFPGRRSCACAVSSLVCSRSARLVWQSSSSSNSVLPSLFSSLSVMDAPHPPSLCRPRFPAAANTSLRLRS